MEEKIIIEINDKEDIEQIKEISEKINCNPKILIKAIIKSIRVNKKIK